MIEENNQTLVEDLARKRFHPLSKAEVRLVRDVPRGRVAFCGPSENPDDPVYAPRNSDHWGPEREIRSEIIRWFCAELPGRNSIDPRGIFIFGAKVVGQLDLSHMKLPFSISLEHCRIVEDMDFSAAEIAELDLMGSWVSSISADRVKVQGSVFLMYPFRADGKVSLTGAQIGGDLVCNTAQITNPSRPNVPESGVALRAERIVIRGSAFLRSGFRAEGLVVLKGAEIGGDLDCTTGIFLNPSQAPGSGDTGAFDAERIVVKGAVFFRTGFYADGDVNLIGAQIGGNLECSQSTIIGELTAEGASIRGTFFWTDIQRPDSSKLDLINATVGSIDDDEKSWPLPGNLILDGFVYSRISGGPRDSKSRIRWIERQKIFRPQPYTYLAKIFNDQGDEAGAKAVLVEMERKARETTWSSLPQSWLVRTTTGYGYYPERAVWVLAGLAGLGWIIFRRAKLARKMIPTDERACELFKTTGGTPDHYRPFSPSLYSLENSLPLVKLDQKDYWHPDPSATSSTAPNQPWTRRLGDWISSPGFLRGFIVAQILLGWILATLFAASLAGLIHKM